MLLKRLLRKRVHQDNITFYLVFIILFLLYIYKLRSSMDGSIWPSPDDYDFIPFPKLWENRVKEYCKNGQELNIEKNENFYEIYSKENLSLFGVVRNKQDKYVRDIGYKQHAFNALVSNNIGNFREIIDTRHKVCRNSSYEIDELPMATIVMCFYNEHKMTLIRSLKSVLVRTPPQLLKEIILVDDLSELPELEFHLLADLHAQLQYDHLKYIRNKKREGLIRSRVIGAREARGEVIVFLDSHIEVNQQWLEPLLELIKIENSTLAVPVIDLINPDTFEYTASPLVRGGFNWGLHYKWENVPSETLKNENDFRGPFKSPTMAGGLFAVNGKYFKHIGEYDLGMDIWGGENLEISFRVWQCGGSIKILPCSRVGHIFRKRRPYSAPNGANTMIKNSMRLANVWMDEYKEYYLKHEKIPKDFNFGDITDRIDLRKRLNCKNFEWYLRNVYSELRLPGEDRRESAISAPVFQPWHSRKRNYISSYMIRLADTDLCASVLNSKVKGFWKKGSSLSLQVCKGKRNQIWFETEKFEIIIDKLFCLEAGTDTETNINKCHEMLGDQQWRHTSTNHSPLYNMARGTCLTAHDTNEGSKIILDLCTENSKKNKWDFVKA